MSLFSLGGKPIKLTEDRIDRLYHDTEHPNRLEVQPYTDTAGISGGENLLEDIHDTIGTGRNGGTFSFEWWFRDQLTIQIFAADDALEDIKSLINSQYANSRMETYQNPAPDARVGDYLHTARLVESADSIYPISFRGADGDPLDGDPYSSTLPKFVNENGVKLIVQGCGKPIKSRWYKRGLVGGDGDKIADSTKQGTLSIGLRAADTKVVKSDLNEDLARDIQDQVGDETFRTTIRVMAVGDNPEAVKSAVKKAAGSFSKYDYADKQKLRPTYQRHTANLNEAEDLIRRRVRHRAPIGRLLHGTANARTIKEWEALFHISNNSIEVPDVKWETRESGPGVPREDTAFHFDMDIPETPAYQEGEEAIEP